MVVDSPLIWFFDKLEEMMKMDNDNKTDTAAVWGDSAAVLPILTTKNNFPLDKNLKKLYTTTCQRNSAFWKGVWTDNKPAFNRQSFPKLTEPLGIGLVIYFWI